MKLLKLRVLELDIAWVQTLVILLTSCVTLGKFFALSILQFPHLQNAVHNSVSIAELS